MAPELIRRTRELLPTVKLVQVYGLSETGYLTGLQDEEHADARLMSCGRPAPGVEVQVADESGNEARAGQRGELVARGSNVMRGYWNDPEDTAPSGTSFAGTSGITTETGFSNSRSAEGHDRDGRRKRLLRQVKPSSSTIQRREVAVFRIPDRSGESLWLPASC